MKKCTKCLIIKNLSLFSKHKSGKDGLRPRCKECLSAEGKLDYLKNKDEVDKRHSLYNKEHKEEIELYLIGYRIENKETLREKQAVYDEQNKDRVAVRKREYSSVYAKEHPAKVAALAAKRRANKLSATPEWLSKAQIEEIRSYYVFAKLWSLITGVPHHVDHIVPLQGETVSGLHVPWNLQIITAKENRAKSNKLLV